MQFPYQLAAKGKYSLKNVRLETGFEYDEEEVIRTKTDLFSIEIENGKIKSVNANDPASDAVDAKGFLMLPAFRDMHIHLDKTLYGLPWQALSPKRRTVKDMIAYEQEIIPELLKTSVERAEQLISLLQHYGTHYARTHFNIDPTSGLQSLENLEKALEHKKDSFKAELVAFPQHGLYYTDTAPLMKEAAQSKSVGFIGSLDPLSIDGNLEKVLDFTVQLALDHQKGIDIHLHEAGESGMKTINYLIDKTIENPELQGKTFISHAFALAHLSPKETERIAERLAEGKVGIASSVPFRGKVMPIPVLKKYGVNVLIGNDNVQDYWSTFGSGNMLQKANLIAELYGYETEWKLSRTLQFATQSILPLDDQGKQQWPKAGDDASIVLADASCSAEAVSRISPIEAFMNNGNLFWRY
ncbi:deaminase [Chryseobacterium shigense]|uniref:Cytosine/adenosine deaminase n=1 Tax=Chryseobacterium shigense TaxID=297244 RepID=A0A1N7K2S1_9FLAO|nr:amidohydrolase [Chryseobacterium shigense]PQA91081.1 deaminase [Chryseobacterium shigense]SIS55890.1 Cytosine/adenosine deaminase [Chryseobacterium shigense]